MTKVTYVPTAEQIEAQKARRQAQASEKAARKASHTGGRTVFDKKQGRYVSIDMKTVNEARAQRQAQAEVARLSNEISRYGGKTVADPTRPGKYISRSVGEVYVDSIEESIKKSTVTSTPKVTTAIAVNKSQVNLPTRTLTPKVSTAVTEGAAQVSNRPTAISNVLTNASKEGGFLSKLGKFFKGENVKTALACFGLSSISFLFGRFLGNAINKNNNDSKYRPYIEPGVHW